MFRDVFSWVPIHRQSKLQQEKISVLQKKKNKHSGGEIKMEINEDVKIC